eukprot:TRINITY_DN1227_c0_g1_i1.p1 TRINITY_DN1227_c0_g1~~TRINITY_DN1227_c0_g1_i1.p1  ORF type:complete len:195 (+),score=39.36 TRINITY_DN1227_c0_g1_i1:144-728(+)
MSKNTNIRNPAPAAAKSGTQKRTDTNTSQRDQRNGVNSPNQNGNNSPNRASNRLPNKNHSGRPNSPGVNRNNQGGQNRPYYKWNKEQWAMISDVKAYVSGVSDIEIYKTLMEFNFNIDKAIDVLLERKKSKWSNIVREGILTDKDVLSPESRNDDTRKPRGGHQQRGPNQNQTFQKKDQAKVCLLYTSPSPRDS